MKELYYSFQPATLIKKAFISEESKIPKTLTQSALSLGTNFLINKVLKGGLSVKGYLLSLAMEKVADYAISKKSELLKSGVSRIGGFIQKIKTNLAHMR